MFKVPESYRVKGGNLGSRASDGNNGAFTIPYPKHNISMRVIATDGIGWEHVSVSIRGKKRVPSWEEMCHVKTLFWDAENAVVQFHPAESEFVNMHQYCLHMWRPTDERLPVPDAILVGLKVVTIKGVTP